MRQATRRIVGPQGQPMIRTATEYTAPSGLRVREVYDEIDMDWVHEATVVNGPWWRRVLDAIVREVRKGGAA